MIPPTCHLGQNWPSSYPTRTMLMLFFGGGGLREEFQKTLVLFRWNSCHGHPRFQEFSSAFCLGSLLSDRKALWTFSLRTGRADRISAANVSRSFCRTERVFHDETAHPWRVGSVSSKFLTNLSTIEGRLNNRYTSHLEVYCFESCIMRYQSWKFIRVRGPNLVWFQIFQNWLISLFSLSQFNYHLKQMIRKNQTG